MKSPRVSRKYWKNNQQCNRIQGNGEEGKKEKVEEEEGHTEEERTRIIIKM